MREYQLMQKNPTPFIEAVPNEENILEWHYIITGPPDGPYAGGQYHGTLTFPADYPFKPPAIRMATPSGRFQTNTRLCLSMSDYHPKTWNPAWNVSTILTGLLSFMGSDEPTVGSINTTDADKKAYAAKSHKWNAELNPAFRLHYRHKVDEYYANLKTEQQTQSSETAASPGAATTPAAAQNPASSMSTAKRTPATNPPVPDQRRSPWRKAYWVVAVAVGWVAISKLIQTASK